MINFTTTINLGMLLLNKPNGLKAWIRAISIIAIEESNSGTNYVYLEGGDFIEVTEDAETIWKLMQNVFDAQK